MAKNADLIITMGCKVVDFCPGPALKTNADWELEDSKDKPIEKVREIRNEIEKPVKKLIKETV